jgi:hypothetical protein
VVPISFQAESARRRRAQRLSSATHTPVADLEAYESAGPDPLPTNYHGLIHLMRRYIALLKVVAGVKSHHYIQVLRIAQELVNNVEFQEVSARQIASLVWQVFLDSRRFFSAGISANGELPMSRLGYFISQLRAGLLDEYANVPYKELVSTSTPIVPAGAPARSRTETSGRPDRQQNSTEPKVFRGVPREVSEAMPDALNQFPNLTMSDIMAATDPPTTYQQIRLGQNGSCLDFLALGRCKSRTCRYKHENDAVVHTQQLTRSVPKIAAAFARYVASQ